MSETSKRALRRLLPLSIAAVLLLGGAHEAAAGEVAVAVGSASHGVQKAGFRIGFGYWGHHGHYWGHHRYYRPYLHYYHDYPFFHLGYYGRYGYPRYSSRHFGALDLNVRPKKTTQVYVDGNYVGTAANFDGWPEYLWLEKDSYEVILYNPGYETVVRHVEIRPGVVIKLREEMRPGESVPVEELTTAGDPPRRSGSAYGRAAPAPPAPPRAAAPPAPRAAPPSGTLDARPEPARVKISIAPADASVYLDGRFLGIAGEIGEERSGILIEPGEHRLEVVRPGYVSREVSFEAEPGEDVELEVELEAGPAATGFSA